MYREETSGRRHRLTDALLTSVTSNTYRDNTLRIEPGSRLTVAKLTQLVDALNQNPRIKSLSIIASHVTDDMVKVLARAQHITTLDLKHNYVSDQGLADLSQMPNLIDLDVSYNRITDKGLVNISKMTKLRTLAIGDNLIDGDGIKFLLQHKTLQILDIRYYGGIGISEQAARLLADSKMLTEVKLGTISPDRGWFSCITFPLAEFQRMDSLKSQLRDNCELNQLSITHGTMILSRQALEAGQLPTVLINMILGYLVDLAAEIPLPLAKRIAVEQRLNERLALTQPVPLAEEKEEKEEKLAISSQSARFGCLSLFSYTPSRAASDDRDRSIDLRAPLLDRMSDNSPSNSSSSNSSSPPTSESSTSTALNLALSKLSS